MLSAFDPESVNEKLTSQLRGNQRYLFLDCKNHVKLEKWIIQGQIDALQTTGINTGNVLCRDFWQTRNIITIYNNSLFFLSSRFSFLFFHFAAKVNGRTNPHRRLAVVASAVVVASICLRTRLWSHCRCSSWMPIPAGVRLRLSLE